MSVLEIEDEVIEIGGEAWRGAVLSADPFEGDFGSGSYLEDKIVKVRNTKKLCHDCYSILKPGTFTRSMVLADEGQILKFRYCEECCNDLGYGEYLFEGGIYIDVDDEEQWNKACDLAEAKGLDEPREYWEERADIRIENENYLINKFGNRFWETPYEILYDVMTKRELETNT